ncbi:hypothetical protein KIW84_062686 [Lathyrus oleraceus]|uniref:Uncharacterized protein n=1 Tax=Pisum sativum TaxID=3888 RepID=A0A9D4W7Q1_PEA|nr:hypothetical protein KIW84_062686 [Pisum sativum]
MKLKLYLHYNSLYGGIPREIANLTELSDLFLNVNHLSGEIPSEFGKMESLQVLQLCYNQLIGSIPTQLGDLKKLSVLALQSNKLAGAIPASLGDLGMLMRLDLSSNNLFGSIPTRLVDAPFLQVRDVHNNTLSGNVPPALKRLDDKFVYEYNLGLCGDGFSSLKACNASDHSNQNRPEPHGAGVGVTPKEIPETAILSLSLLPWENSDYSVGVYRCKRVLEFKPTPLENRDCFKTLYSVKHTLLVKFNSDTIDETNILEETLTPHVDSFDGTANAVIAYNNRPATEAVPYFEQLGPAVSQMMPIVEANPILSLARSAQGDAWKMMLDTVGLLVKHQLQHRVFEFSVTRATLIYLLLDMIKPETEVSDCSDKTRSQIKNCMARQYRLSMISAQEQFDQAVSESLQSRSSKCEVPKGRAIQVEDNQGAGIPWQRFWFGQKQHTRFIWSGGINFRKKESSSQERNEMIPDVVKVWHPDEEDRDSKDGKLLEEEIKTERVGIDTCSADPRWSEPELSLGDQELSLTSYSDSDYEGTEDSLHVYNERNHSPLRSHLVNSNTSLKESLSLYDKTSKNISVNRKPVDISYY